MRNLIAILGFSLLLPGCPAIQSQLPPTPATPMEGIAEVTLSVKAAAKSTTHLIDAGAIKPDQAKPVLQVLDGALGMLTLAKTAAASGNLADASTQLQLARDALTQATKFLAQYNALPVATPTGGTGQ